MFCARCGGQVGEADRACPECGSELGRPGALRFTSSREPAQSIDDVFPEMKQPPAEWFDDAERTRTTPAGPRLPRVRPRFVALPDPDRLPRRRILTGLVLLACLCVVGMALYGIRMVQRQVSAPVAVATPHPTATPTRAASRPAVPAPKLPATTPSTPASVPSSRARAMDLPSSAKVCSATVGANSTTSCGFAQAVAAALPKNPQGSFTVQATSPSTGRSYSLSCTAGQMVVCTGGNSAAVYVLY